MGDNFYSVDGINAVRCEIDERNAIYVTGLDFGDGESWSCTRYVDVERGEFVVSAEIVDMRLHEFVYRLCGLNAEWERISEALERTIRSWDACCRLYERLQYRKCRKTTYKTIRRECAKRNRHK